MNLRIPNLFKSIRERLFHEKEKEKTVKAIDMRITGVNKNKRISHGGNGGGDQTKKNYKKEFAYKTLEKMHFGTFSPIGKF